MQPVFTASSWPIHFEYSKEYLAIHSAKPLQILTSAIIAPNYATTIVNRYVPKSYCPQDPKEETKKWLREHHWNPQDTVALLTAAHIELGTCQVQEQSTFRLAVWATVGLGNATRAGKPGPIYTYCPPGTINLMILIDGKVTLSAMVNAVITATEAKSAALQDLSIMDRDGHIATGTNTDAIAIAATQQPIGDYVHEYAGVSSPLGQAIGELVYQTVYQTAQKEIALKKSR